jgi:hypothetical protein
MLVFVCEKLSAWTEQKNFADLSINTVDLFESSETFGHKIHSKNNFCFSVTFCCKIKLVKNT